MHTLNNSTSADAYLCYEVFLFDTGDIFLNVIKAPQNSCYLGTSQLVCSGGTKSFTLVAGEGKRITFTHLNDAGSGYSLTYGLIPLEAPYDKKFLVTDKDGRIYTIEIDNEQTLVEIENVIELSAELFQTFGVDNLPANSLLMNLLNPGILFWQDSLIDLPTILISPFPTSYLSQYTSSFFPGRFLLVPEITFSRYDISMVDMDGILTTEEGLKMLTDK